MSLRLLSLNTARVQALATPQGEVRSGIAKRGRDGAVAVGTLGLEGDEQADLTVHGGPAKAIYAYASEHYAFWQTVRAQAGVSEWGQVLPWGSLGENLTLSGLLENEVWIGDRLVFPDCELIVSEPRYPCFKFNAVMGFNQAAKLMTQSAWCGFYLAVARAGTLSTGQPFELLAGPREVGIVELFKARTRRAT